MNKLILIGLLLLPINVFGFDYMGEWRDLFGHEPKKYEVNLINSKHEMDAYYFDEFPCYAKKHEFKIEKRGWSELAIYCIDIPPHITFAYEYADHPFQDNTDGDADGVLICELEKHPKNDREFNLDFSKSCKSYDIKIK
jgi:hypothetical protein